MVPDENDSTYFATFMKGWRNWLAKHPDSIPSDVLGYPECGKFMSMTGPPSITKLVLKMMHPDPDKRLSVHDAVSSRFVENIECCSPESYEVTGRVTDTSGKPKPRTKLYKHNHIPPKDHKTPKMFQHTFDLDER